MYLCMHALPLQMTLPPAQQNLTLFLGEGHSLQNISSIIDQTTPM